MAVFTLFLLRSLIYGTVAFAIGFVFGALRQLLLIPQFGERTGYLIEFPLVTVGVAAFGWWLARARALRPPMALAVGIAGVAVLLAIESLFAFGVMDMTLEIYLSQLNPFGGSLFPYGLLAMALAPWLASLRRP